jgi:hypothetical protein
MPTTNNVLKTAYLSKNVINLLKQKGAQKVTIILGYFILSKNHNEPPKVAQLAKNCPIWSPCLWAKPGTYSPLGYVPAVPANIRPG